MIATLLGFSLIAGSLPAMADNSLTDYGVNTDILGTITKTVTLSGTINVGNEDGAKISVLVTNQEAKDFTDKKNFVYVDQLDLERGGAYSLTFTDSGVDAGDYIINMNIAGSLLTQTFNTAIIKPTMQLTENGKEIQSLDYITGNISATAELGTPMNAMFICAQYKDGQLVHTQVKACSDTQLQGEMVSLPVDYKGSLGVDEVKLFFWDSVTIAPITEAKVVVSVMGDNKDYPMQWSTVQGTNNWYYCISANGELLEATYNETQQYWESDSCRIFKEGVQVHPLSTKDAVMVFKAPFDGLVRTTINVGELKFIDNETYAQSDGVNLSILRDGEDKLWSSEMQFGNTPSYDVTTSLRAGQELWFVTNCKGHDAYDEIIWQPSVSYVGKYVGEPEEDYTYYEKTSGNLVELIYDADTDVYPAGDDYINKYMLKQTGDTSFVKRYVVPSDSRYQVSGNLLAKDNNSDTIVTIYKNEEEVSKQLIPAGENGEFDIRMRANQGDTLDVELSLLSASGKNTSVWESRVTHVPGPVSETKASTSQGDNFTVVEEYPLTSFLTDANSDFCLVKNGVKFPMINSNGTWKSTEDTTAKITSTTVQVTENDVVMEIKAPKSGKIKLSGTFKLAGKSDGVLTKIYNNGEFLWSNRVGGERFVRWDEPYDVSYFQNEVSAVANVTAGDTLTFNFNRWRLSTGDLLNIEDVKLSYITGDVLSETTKWKLTQCTLKSDANKEADIAAATAEGKNVAEGDGFIVIYPGLPTFIGYPELSEISVAIKGGELNV